MSKERSKFAQAVMLLVGTIIGAGVLGIPYVIAKSGFLLGLFNILALGFIILLLNLYIGEVSLRTKGNHMLAGYAEKYIGKWGKHIMALTAMLGVYGALTAYAIGEGEVLSALLGGPTLFWSLAFFTVFSLLLYFDLKFIAEWDLLISGLMVFFMASIIFLGAPHVSAENLSGFNLSNAFLPYGVIFFAFIGASAIPEMRAELGKNSKKLKNAILLGSGSVVLLYFLFALVIVGVTGLQTTEVSTIGLGNVLGERILVLGNLFALFSMASSFLLLGLALKWMFKYDYGLSWTTAWVATWIIPLVVFLNSSASFVSVMGLTGAVAGGIEGILLVLIAWHAKKKGERKPEYSVPLNLFIASVLIAVFVAGIAYQFLF